MQEPVLHAVVEAQTRSFLQAPVVTTHVCVLSHALVVRVEPVHESLAHDAPVAVYRQPPLPSHFPSSPQGGLAVHVPCPSSPALTARHLPSAAELPLCLFRARVHAEQAEQSWSQQTPSARMLDLHSDFWDAGDPFTFLAAQTAGLPEVLQ
jgi:hypothetical protein